MHLQAIHDLAQKGLLLWRLTDDPLTLSAATALLKAKEPLNKQEQLCVTVLEKQLEAYAVLYTKPLV